MYCANCGKPLSPGASACSSCGTPVPRDEAGLYAGFWRRAAAYVVDSFVLLVPGFLIGYFLPDQLGNFVAQVLMWWLYKALMESGSLQATVGKRAFGIKVTDLAGERITFGRASGRFFAQFLSGIILMIGFVMAGLTAKKQALHDLVAKCLVVRGSASAEQARLGGQTMPVTGGVWAVVILLFIVPFFGGMIAAVAIPAYQDYTIRAKIVQAIDAAGPSRDAPADSPYVRKVIGSKSSSNIDILLDAEKVGLASGTEPRIRYVAAGEGKWTCSAEEIPNKYLPASCRQ